MTYYYFSKGKLDWQNIIIVFEQGCLGKPVCILDKDAIERLNKEWHKEEKPRGTLRSTLRSKSTLQSTGR